METIYYTATTLDGYIADPDNSLDWLFQFADGPGDEYREFIANVGAICMGSTTYRWLLDHMKKPEGGMEPWPYEQPTWVFSTRELPPYPDADIRFVRGDVAEVHRTMAEAAGGKNIWVAGGGDLVGQFFDHGLLDALIVSIAPVTLGAGAPLLPRRIVTPPMKLHSVQTLGGAFLHVRYNVVR